MLFIQAAFFQNCQGMFLYCPCAQSGRIEYEKSHHGSTVSTKQLQKYNIRDKCDSLIKKILFFPFTMTHKAVLELRDLSSTNHFSAIRAGGAGDGAEGANGPGG